VELGSCDDDVCGGGVCVSDVDVVVVDDVEVVVLVVWVQVWSGPH
jgi:hypothetical protein